jgi:hypothetical protein
VIIYATSRRLSRELEHMPHQPTLGARLFAEVSA